MKSKCLGWICGWDGTNITVAFSFSCVLPSVGEATNSGARNGVPNHPIAVKVALQFSTATDVA